MGGEERRSLLEKLFWALRERLAQRLHQPPPDETAVVLDEEAEAEMSRDDYDRALLWLRERLTKDIAGLRWLESLGEYDEARSNDETRRILIRILGTVEEALQLHERFVLDMGWYEELEAHMADLGPFLNTMDFPAEDLELLEMAGMPRGEFHDIFEPILSRIRQGEWRESHAFRLDLGRATARIHARLRSLRSAGSLPRRRWIKGLRVFCEGILVTTSDALLLLRALELQTFEEATVLGAVASVSAGESLMSQGMEELLGRPRPR